MSTVTLNLTKGQRIDLTKGSGLTALSIGLGWDAGGRDDFDLDASAMISSPTGKQVVFYNNLTAPGVTHSGDNLTGAGAAGDKEVIAVDTAALPGDTQSIYAVINIHKAAERNQNFGMVGNAYVRIFDTTTGTEICRYDLSEDYSTATGVVAGRIYEKDGEWKFAALGDGVTGDLQTIINNLP